MSLGGRVKGSIGMIPLHFHQAHFKATQKELAPPAKGGFELDMIPPLPEPKKRKKEQEGSGISKEVEEALLHPIKVVYTFLAFCSRYIYVKKLNRVPYINKNFACR
jgi:hypothetical protein